MPDPGRIGWFRTCWVRAGRLSDHRKSAWHFCDGRVHLRFTILPGIPKAICGYEPAYFSSPREWSLEPDVAKFRGPVCDRCRRALER